MINIGVIGAGAWASEVLACLRGIRGARAVGIQNRTAANARVLAARFGIPTVYLEFEELCASREVDAVMVLTHESAHVEPALCALDAGKHVFVEKPMADTVESAQRMAECAEQSVGTLMPGHILRFTAQCQAAKRRLADAGPVRAVRCYQHRTKSLYANYCRPHIALSIMIHHLDLCRWFTGRPVQRVAAVERFHLGDSYPSTVWATLLFEGGAVATLQSGWVLEGELPIFWEDGIEIIADKQRIRIDFREGCEVRTEQGIEREDTSYDPALRVELDYWLNCIEQGTAPTIVTPRDGVEAVALAGRVIAAGKSEGDAG